VRDISLQEPTHPCVTESYTCGQQVTQEEGPGSVPLLVDFGVAPELRVDLNLGLGLSRLLPATAS
jgi:hypothetical protein